MSIYASFSAKVLVQLLLFSMIGCFSGTKAKQNILDVQEVLEPCAALQFCFGSMKNCVVVQSKTWTTSISNLWNKTISMSPLSETKDQIEAGHFGMKIDCI